MSAILVLSVAGIFLTLDSALAVIFGKRYMLWGLEYTPRAYSELIHSIAMLPASTLLIIKIVELLAGLAFLAVVVYFTFVFAAL